MNVVRVFALDPGPRFVYASLTLAPGTATLLTNGGGVAGIRRSAHVSSRYVLPMRCGFPRVGDPVTVSTLNTLSIGFGHPGRRSSGTKNGECIACASSTAYDWACVLSLMPPDWKPAVIELPIET